MNDVERILTYELDELRQLWRDIRARKTPDWQSGRAFEYFIIRAFQLEGAEVRYPYSVDFAGVQIEQIDGIIYTDGLAFLVESKDHSKPINVEPIAKLRSQLSRRPDTTLGIIFSTSGFTIAALRSTEILAPQNILLWDGSEISYALQTQQFRRSLIQKYRYCVEYAKPFYNIISESEELS